MNTNQLKCTIACDSFMVKYTEGIFAVDLLPQHNFKTLPRALIVNVSTHDQVGFHWVALFIVDTRKAEFFDSYGLAPSQYSKYFSEFFQRQDITKIDYNTKRFQSDQTNVCGHYVLYYLHMRCMGVSLTDIVNIFDVNFMNNDIYVYDYVSESFSCCQL